MSVKDALETPRMNRWSNRRYGKILGRRGSNGTPCHDGSNAMAGGKV
jgi:hypothetical protein